MSLPLVNIPCGGAKGIKYQYNYIILYGDFKNPEHPGRGNRKKDTDEGTFHLDIGRDRGLVKKISFSKNNIKYHRESRMFNQGQAGLLQLSAVYNCSIEMIGNNLFLPGMEVWVNPYGFGGEAFGKPQDPPLIKMPSGNEIDERNALYNAALLPETEDPPAVKINEVEIAQIRAADKALQDKYNVDYELGGSGMEVDIEQVDADYINSYANVMGIGGYQIITRIQNSISPGKFTTTVQAKHIYTGYPGLKDANKLYAEGKKKLNDPATDKPGEDAACTAVIARLEHLEFEPGAASSTEVIPDE